MNGTTVPISSLASVLFAQFIWSAVYCQQILCNFDDHKVILYRQQDGSWVAEIPAISGCYALMPTREAALAELSAVFNLIAEEYHDKGLTLPSDTTEIVNA